MNNINYNKDIVFGIDLGVASVGWSVIEKGTVLDKGVVLFEQANKAEDRRLARGSRRRLKRRRHRIERMIKLLESNGIKAKNSQNPKLIDVRIRALSEKVSMQDVVDIIMYFVRHRGYIPFKDETRESEIINKLKQNFEYACQIQKELINKNNKYRGMDLPVLHEDYVKELKDILKKQSEYYKNIDSKFIEDVVGIIDSKRKFWEGPGAPRLNSLTPYGRYRTKDDLEKYKIDNRYRKYLYQDLIGSCSVYTDEKKASMFSYYAEEFNFYNCFVNIRINKDQVNEKNINSLNFVEKIGDNKIYKFTSDAIEKIKDEIFKSKTVGISKIIKELFGIEEFHGVKKDGNGNQEFSRFQTTKTIKNSIDNDVLYEKILEDKDLYNKLIMIIQNSPDEYTRKDIIEMTLKESGKDNLLTEELINKLCKVKLDNKYHSFSDRALNVYLYYMKLSNINSSETGKIYKSEIASDVETNLINKYISKDIKEGDLKYINSKPVDDIIASPATKKSLRKSISLINKLFSKYGYPNTILIETTKSLLSKEKQKEYEAQTLDNENKRKFASAALEKAGYSISQVNIEKYMLLQETANKCSYCNQDINVNNCEIEHILPESITADNSYANKTVSCTKCNHEKGNRIPSKYIVLLKGEAEYKNFKDRIKKNQNMIDKKKEYILFEGDLNKYEKRFKNRNLNDTAYATNELANQISFFKKAYVKHNFGEILETKVIRVPGQFTNLVRVKYKLLKDRSDNCHHACDAVIIASMYYTQIGKLMNLVQNNTEKYWLNQKIEEFRDNVFNQMMITPKTIDVIKSATNENTRFSKEVKKDIDGQLFNSNISKGIIKDEKLCSIQQIDNIYELSHAEVNKIFVEKPLRFLCIEKDKKLYEKLIRIIKQYEDCRGNQFVAYCKENLNEDWTNIQFNPNIHGIIRNEKKGSPIINKLRYYVPATAPFIIKKKSINKKEDTINMYLSTSSYCTRIYKDQDEKIYFMPIYKVFVDQKSGEIMTSSNYYKTIYDLYVGKPLGEVNKYMDLFNGEYVRFEDNKGNASEGLVEYFDKPNNKIVIKNTNINITKKTKKIEKIKSDILGLYNLNIL